MGKIRRSLTSESKVVRMLGAVSHGDMSTRAPFPFEFYIMSGVGDDCERVEFWMLG